MDSIESQQNLWNVLLDAWKGLFMALLETGFVVDHYG
jgi:hypothetical protein